MTQAKNPDLMTPAEVAALWKVDRKTVNRWASEGRLPPGTFITTPGGHHRYHRARIMALLNGDGGRP